MEDSSIKITEIALYDILRPVALVTQLRTNNNDIALKAEYTNPFNLIEDTTMAFANEYLTDEEERKKYGSAHVTLDRERDAWLTRSGGAGRPDEFPQFVELHWQGEEIMMHAYEKPKKNANDETEIDWYVAKMKIPENLEASRKEIIEIVKEALIAHKSGGISQFDSRIKDVNVEFSDHVINYKSGEPTWM